MQNMVGLKTISVLKLFAPIRAIRGQICILLATYLTPTLSSGPFSLDSIFIYVSIGFRE